MRRPEVPDLQRDRIYAPHTLFRIVYHVRDRAYVHLVKGDVARDGLELVGFANSLASFVEGADRRL